MSEPAPRGIEPDADTVDQCGICVGQQEFGLDRSDRLVGPELGNERRQPARGDLDVVVEERNVRGHMTRIGSESIEVGHAGVDRGTEAGVVDPEYLGDARAVLGCGSDRM